MFRGSAPARIDDKGRLKMPTVFRAVLENKYGRELYLTSIHGDHARIYPMPVWLELEEKINAMPSTHPARVRFLERVNFYGQEGELDAQGRVLIPLRLREAAAIAGDVDVLGYSNYVGVWNHDRFVLKLQREPYTENDERAISEFGV